MNGQRRAIPIVVGDVFGSSGVRAAPDLLVRQVDSYGTIWATRGFSLYRADFGADEFEFVMELPNEGVMHLMGRKVVRQWFNYHDVVQPFWAGEGVIVVFSSGFIWRAETASGDFEKVARLRNWGPRTGRGVLHHGFAEDADGRMYFGEYFRNTERAPVRLYASDDGGSSWYVQNEFQSGHIRHIHAIQIDPYDGHLWMCTGDTDEESMVASSSDGGRSFKILGAGNQLWRTCCLVFTQNRIFWGVDTSRDVESRYICSATRDGEFRRETAIDGAAEFGAALGSEGLCFATTRNGLERASDESPSVWLEFDGEWKRVRLGQWLPRRPRRAGTPYMYSDEKNSRLIISLVNIEPARNHLIMLSEQLLRELHATS